MNPGICKSCKAEIFWIKTPVGKNHPVDRKPEKMWVNLCGRGGIVELLDCYRTHFATCPNAKEHRKDPK